MPKGETSRPLTSVERKALKTLLNLRYEMKGKSRKNVLEILMGDRFRKASGALMGAKEKEAMRKHMKDIGRKEGASRANMIRRRLAKNM